MKISSSPDILLIVWTCDELICGTLQFWWGGGEIDMNMNHSRWLMKCL